MLRRVALVRTDISEELSASSIRVTRIGELGTTLAVTINRRTASVVPSSPILVILMKEGLSSSEMSVLTRASRRNIPEDTILHSHRRENLKSYITYLHFTCSTCVDIYTTYARSSSVEALCSKLWPIARGSRRHFVYHCGLRSPYVPPMDRVAQLCPQALG
jgi:hypothetical protein